MLASKILSSAPHIATQRALLVLDLQNDFVRQHGNLFIPNTADFLSFIPDLARLFRDSGEVIWVQSVFERRRPVVNEALGGGTVVLEDGPPATTNAPAPKRSTKKQQAEQAQQQSLFSDDLEAFLSASDKACAGRRCCLPNSSGFHFPAPILAAIDPNEDTVLVKSEYSAFETPGLLLSLRSRFVTEIFVCGSLSNASVYATVVDAVRHGLAVTLIEDCLGYRSSLRHREAMRRMADIMGANGITSSELMDGQDFTVASPVREQADSSLVTGIEEKIGTLGLSSPNHQSADSQSATRRFEEGGADEPQDILQTSQRPVDRPEEKEFRTSQDGQQQPVESPSLSRNQKAPLPLVCSPGDCIASGDSRILYDLAIPADSFQRLRGEVDWQKMYHMSGQVPRMVSVQGNVAPDGSIPIYRHPADESPPLSPFSKTVDEIRMVVEKQLGHPLNHALIQLYRDGEDRISEHSDKTLDIVRGSNICNVSLGALRTMTLRTKVDAKKSTNSPSENARQTQRVPMPHNSLFILGEKSNMEWLHGIRPDKRMEKEKSKEEKGFNGERISLTFRHIGTYINPKSDTIWGQGAVSKEKERAGKVVHGVSSETERMIRAFGQENHQSNFDWDINYGRGFDVVNFVTTSSVTFVPGACDKVTDLQVRLALTENGIRYKISTAQDCPSNVEAGTKTLLARREQPSLLVDADGPSVLTGRVAILQYIAKTAHRRLTDMVPDPDMKADGLTLEDRLDAADELHHAWIASSGSNFEQATAKLSTFNSLICGKLYINGKLFGVDDCAFWSVLKQIMETKDSDKVVEEKFPLLMGYYSRVRKRACVKQVMDEMLVASG
ncbi:isochorismatase family protein [Nannizzia gypsea CBS 118893]|uniref:Isochorismatase family protein n=1 Tax=Arthroderma gypseum (strain ATCC MYA-4604 / CBS 118893) TaxID=535722 RepID=E4UZN4_ARTGP|nr:isochorismatase family protein [Nannizzia gypsea CBS 118893]EFR03564.1 isochorismatase family protein [Nannizzia gypsea CBS 118893]